VMPNASAASAAARSSRRLSVLRAMSDQSSFIQFLARRLRRAVDDDS
jgi:hypothetical protein